MGLGSLAAMSFKILLNTALVGFLFTLQAFALSTIQVQVDQKVSHGNGSVGVGSRLTMKVGSSKTVNGIFLGKIVEPSGQFSKYMLLDETNSKVFFANKSSVEIPSDNYQPILKPYEQIGGTCTGYAIDHYLQQMIWSGFRDNGQLRTAMSSEKGRTQLLVDSINEYYLVLQHRYSLVGVMNKFGLRFGFKCKTKQFMDSESAILHVRQQLSTGLPMMISFNTGPNMVDAPVSIQDYETKGELDIRLWVPRKKGERASGGHSVVAASLFEFKGNPFLLMLDSDWSEPRIWDLKSYFTAKTAIEEVEFITCK